MVLLFLIRKRDVDGYAGRLVFWALLCLIAQAATGVAQSRLGLPVGIVIIHIILASSFISILTFIQLAYGRKR
jgi:heme A synthase